jgi:co-chaperonin GroES (HSP10)
MIKPYGKHVLVSRDPDELPQDWRVRPERIIVPEIVMARARWGKVVDVGSGVTEIRPGDRVSITWFNGTAISQFDNKLEIFHEDELLAVEVSS